MLTSTEVCLFSEWCDTKKVSTPADGKIWTHETPVIKIWRGRERTIEAHDWGCFASADAERAVALHLVMSQWVTQLEICSCGFIMTGRRDNNLPSRQVLKLLCCSGGLALITHKHMWTHADCLNVHLCVLHKDRLSRTCLRA